MYWGGFATIHNGFATIRNGSERFTYHNQRYRLFLKLEMRTEPIETYCLAHVKRKKNRIYVNNKTYFRLSASMSPRKPFREIILPDKILT